MQRWFDPENPEVKKFCKENEVTFDKFRKYLLDEVFFEPIVGMDEFIDSPDYLGESLGGIVYPNVRAMAVEFDRPEYREGFLGIGMSAGKSLSAGLFLVRQHYKVQCLRHPNKFLKIRKSQLLTSLNLAQSEKQAKAVIFDNALGMVDNSPWFRGKFTARSGDIYFSRTNSALISGHSKSSVWRGYTNICVAMDELSWMVNSANHDNAKECYDVARNGMKGRFPVYYKLFGISSLKAETDFLTKKLEALRKDADYVESLVNIGGKDYTEKWGTAPHQIEKEL